MGTHGTERVADDELLSAVGAGDRGALRELYERHAPWLTVRLSRRSADPGLVDEVLQDTFLAVWQRPDAYAGTGAVAAWLWGIAVRRLIDHLRRQSVRARVVPRLSRPEPSAEEQVLLGVEFGDLAGALQRLSPELRAVLQATALDGLTMREAGRFLGIPTGTVKTRLMRARAELREALA